MAMNRGCRMSLAPVLALRYLLIQQQNNRYNNIKIIMPQNHLPAAFQERNLQLSTLSSVLLLCSRGCMNRKSVSRAMKPW